MDASLIGPPICSHLPGPDRFVLATLLRLPSVQALALHSIDSASIDRASARGLADLLRFRFVHATVALGSVRPPETLLWTLRCHEVSTSSSSTSSSSSSSSSTRSSPGSPPPPPPPPPPAKRRLEFWVRTEKPSRAITCASKAGHVGVLECWRELGQGLFDMAGAALESVRFAQSCGQVDVLEWWRTSGFMVWTWSSGLRSASEDGHVSVLEWWKSLGMPLMWDAVSCVNVAARSGRVEVLEWWRTSGIPVNWTDTAVLSYASENGHLTVLEWWKRHEFLSPRKDVVQSGIENALRCGSVPALEFWREYAPDAFAANCVSTLAVEKGHVEVLEWLKLSGYQISSSSPGIAALHDQAAVLEWLRNSGLQMDWDMNRLRSTLLHRRQALKWLCENHGHVVAVSQAEVASALRNAYIWILDYAMDCKPNKMLRTWRDEWLEDAAGAGNLSVFEWRLRRIWKRKPFTAVPEAVLCSASTRGRVEILQWLKDHNILMSCTQAVIHAACAGKSVAVLQRWKEYCDTFSFSSEFVLGHSIGDVDLLEWWRRSGFELDWPSSVSMHRVCCNSPRSRLADVLQWWTETGAAFDDVAKATAYLMARDDVATLEWMESIAMSVAPPRGVEGRNLSRWWEEYRECQR